MRSSSLKISAAGDHSALLAGPALSYSRPDALRTSSRTIVSAVVADIACVNDLIDACKYSVQLLRKTSRGSAAANEQLAAVPVCIVVATSGPDPRPHGCRRRGRCAGGSCMSQRCHSDCGLIIDCRAAQRSVPQQSVCGASQKLDLINLMQCRLCNVAT